MPRRIFWYLFRNITCGFSQCFNARIQSVQPSGKEQHGSRRGRGTQQQQQRRRAGSGAGSPGQWRCRTPGTERDPGGMHRGAPRAPCRRTGSPPERGRGPADTRDCGLTAEQRPRPREGAGIPGSLGP